MKRLYLHIGQPKTATTTIQNFLALNQAALRNEGWLYPDAGRQYAAHHHLANFFRPSPLHWIRVVDPVACYANLLKEVEDSRCDNVIMSTEALYFTPDPSLITAYFKDFRVTPVVFLRRQDEWLESAYREGRKNGEVRISIQDYRTHMRPVMDYASVLEKWQACFPDEKIIVGSFEKRSGTLPVEQEFMRRIGIETRGELSPVRIKNETFSRDAVEFYDRFSERPRVSEKHEVFKDALVAYSKAHKDPVGSGGFLSPEEARSIVEEFTESNDRVARNFLKPGEKLFEMAPPSDTTPWKPYKGLTAESAALIGEALANHVYELYQNALGNRKRNE